MIRNKIALRSAEHRLYLCIQKKKFTVDGTRLSIEDIVPILSPWRGERVLWIAGTNAYYSVTPIFSVWHRLLCFCFCEEALKKTEPGFCRHALVLGCGGGAVPRWLLEEYPSLTVDVVDRSPQIIGICKKYFMRRWRNSSRLQFFCTDAQDYVAPEYSYQFIFCDLFDGMNLAPFVYSRGFAGKLREMIGDRGILIVNCGWNHLYAVRQAFAPYFDEIRVLDRDPGQTEVIEAFVGRVDYD